jgi:sulfide:quinone oxidoreductase
MNSKTVLILGGGIGGIVTANALRRLLPYNHKVILVEKNHLHAFAPSFLWTMVGTRREKQIVREMHKLIRPGVEVVYSEVQGIDPSKQIVSTKQGALSYDYMIIALGAELAPEKIPGLSEGAHTFYTLEGSLKLREALASFKGGSIALVIASMPYKCPGAPHEAAMLMADYFKEERAINKAYIHIYTPESKPMPVAGHSLGKAVTDMLASKGISFHPLHKLVSVDAQKNELNFEGKASVHYDLLVAVPPHRAPVAISGSGLTNEAGWLPVDHTTLATKYENIYAIGDITAISLPGRWKPDIPLMLPKAGVFAHAHALVVAKRLADILVGRLPKDEFCGDGYCMLEAGEDLAGFAYGNFFAEPSPQVHLKRIGRSWHIGKVLFEKWWLSAFGLKRELLRLMIISGAKMKGIPIKL